MDDVSNHSRWRLEKYSRCYDGSQNWNHVTHMNMFLIIDISILNMKVLIEGDQGSKNEAVILENHCLKAASIHDSHIKLIAKGITLGFRYQFKSNNLLEQRKFQIKFKEEKPCLSCTDLLTQYMTCKRVFNRPMMTSNAKVSARESLGSFIFSEDTVPPSQSQSQSFSQAEGIESNVNIDFEQSTGSSQSGGLLATQNKESQNLMQPSQEQKGLTKLYEVHSESISGQFENYKQTVEASVSGADVKQSDSFIRNDMRVSSNRENIRTEVSKNPDNTSSSKQSIISKDGRNDINAGISNNLMDRKTHQSSSPHIPISAHSNTTTFPIAGNSESITALSTVRTKYNQSYNGHPNKHIANASGSTVDSDPGTSSFEHPRQTPVPVGPPPLHTTPSAINTNLIGNTTLFNNLTPQFQQLPSQVGYGVLCQQPHKEVQSGYDIKPLGTSQNSLILEDKFKTQLNVPHNMNNVEITSFQALLEAPELPKTVLNTFNSSVENQNCHLQETSTEYLTGVKENLQDFSDEELLDIIAAILKDPEFPPLVERIEKLWALKIIGNF